MKLNSSSGKSSCSSMEMSETSLYACKKSWMARRAVLPCPTNVVVSPEPFATKHPNPSFPVSTITSSIFFIYSLYLLSTKKRAITCHGSGEGVGLKAPTPDRLKSKALSGLPRNNAVVLLPLDLCLDSAISRDGLHFGKESIPPSLTFCTIHCTS